MLDVARMDAVSQAELIRGGHISALELVEAAIKNVETLNGQLNAVIHQMFEAARRHAAGQVTGPLAGVPFLLKDMVAEQAGEPYAAGSGFLSGHVSTTDAELTRRYRHAGLVTIGKTNVPEFAVGPTTEPRLHGPTRNPWSPALTTGGSSGGSAAAVAAGLVSVAHANDGGGSIRIPASCCGLVGLKPSRGRNPLGPTRGEVWGGLLAEHVVTRSVRDSAAVLDAVHGGDPGAPSTPPGPRESFGAAAASSPGRLRIAFTDTTYAGDPVHADCRDAVRAAAALCESLGHTVEEAGPDIDADELFDKFTLMLGVATATTVRDTERVVGRRATEQDLEPLVWKLAQRGEQISAPAYLSAVQDLQLLTRRVARFHQDYDVFLTPTLGLPPVPLGSFRMDADSDPIDVRRKMWTFAPFPQLQNVTGQPAMSLPLHWNADNLPIGVQIVGRYGDEETLFRLAGQLETARPWAQRWPALSIAHSSS